MYLLYLMSTFCIPKIGSLLIESAKKRDTGNYTCSPSNSPSVTVTLNVINGKFSEDLD